MWIICSCYIHVNQLWENARLLIDCRPHFWGWNKESGEKNFFIEFLQTEKKCENE